MKIGVLPGDDIGYEVVPETVKVLSAAASCTGLEIEWVTLPIGKEGHEKHGDTTHPVTLEALKKTDGWIMGPIGHSAYLEMILRGLCHRSVKYLTFLQV